MERTMVVDVYERPPDEVWVRAYCHRLTDWDAIRVHLTPSQAEQIRCTSPTPLKVRDHRATSEEAGAHGFKFETWVTLALNEDAKRVERLAEASWLCELCDLDIPVEVTVSFMDDPANEKMCLGCCSAMVVEQAKPGYVGPKIRQFYLYPTVLDADMPPGVWQLQGESFRFVGDLV